MDTNKNVSFNSFISGSTAIHWQLVVIYQIYNKSGGGRDLLFDVDKIHEIVKPFQQFNAKCREACASLRVLKP